MKSTAIKIDNASLGKKAASIIRNRIIEGIYSQGSRLIEEELSNEFEISRVCVRDALLILESEGMVVRQRNKYTRVIELDEKSIVDLFIFRRALETLSIEQCILKNNIPMQQLTEAICKLENLSKSKSMRAREYVEEDLKFHEHIICASENSHVINVWIGIKYQMQTLLFDIYANQSFSFAGLAQHRSLMEHISNKRIKEAQMLLAQHIQDNLDFIISHK